MARVLVPSDGHWYDELKAVGYYSEGELEDAIQQHVASLFPSHFVFPYKQAVVGRTSQERKKPDMAFVRKDIQDWGIVEVELADHLLSHVLEQTQIFADGDYNAPTVADYIRQQLSIHCGRNVALRRISQLVTTKRPQIYVIADTAADHWRKDLTNAGIHLCTFEIYKSLRGGHIYRTFGDYPEVAQQQAHCRPHPSLSNVWEIVGVFRFRQTSIHIEASDGLTRWAVISDAGKQYIRFVGKSNPLFPSATYSLIEDKQKRYRLIRN